jgi:thimet oligopeptidase
MKFLSYFKVIKTKKSWKKYQFVTFRLFNRHNYGYTIHLYFIEEIQMTQFKRNLMIWSILFVLLAVFLAFGETGPESLSDQEISKFKTFCEHELQEARQLLHDLENYQGPKTVKTVLNPLNEIWIKMDYAYNLASLYQSVHPNSAMRDVGAEYDQKFSKLETEIQMSRPIYDAVSQVDVGNADPKTQRFVEKTLRDFRRAGVDKDPQTRQKIKKLQEELVVIGQDFQKNIREDVRSIQLSSVEDLKGLPDDFIATHKPNSEGKIIITTDYPDYFPFIGYAESDTWRLELYKKYRSRGYPKNKEVLVNMLRKRFELAQLLGYKNYAEYVTEDKMIKDPTAAQNFIDRVAEVASSRAKEEYEMLLNRLQQDQPTATEVNPWQKTYLTELVKKESYDIDSRELRQYFPYDRVREGLFELTSKMYQVTYKEVDTTVWHPDVEVYEIWSEGNLIGRFYLDMHPRKDKYKHAMMTQVVSGIGGRQAPEAALVCNFPGGDGTDGLMEHDQVSTFFHEFGHLLHHIFAGNQPWMNITGITTEWDFVETPSILFEEWIWDADILKTFAISPENKTIPDNLISKLNRARMFNEALSTKQQMFYASISLNFYNRKYSSFNPLEKVIELQNKYTPYKYVDETYMHMSFGHLFDYSAIYYTYMWSAVIAKDLFTEFQQGGLDNSEVAVKYRKIILEPGGSKDAAILVKDFLGRDYSFEAFKNWLNSGNI